MDFKKLLLLLGGALVVIGCAGGGNDSNLPGNCRGGDLIFNPSGLYSGVLTLRSTTCVSVIDSATEVPVLYNVFTECGPGEEGEIIRVLDDRGTQYSQAFYDALGPIAFGVASDAQGEGGRELRVEIDFDSVDSKSAAVNVRSKRSAPDHRSCVASYSGQLTRIL